MTESPVSPEESHELFYSILGGPCRMRVSTLLRSPSYQGADHMDSNHQVAPTAAHGRIIEAAPCGSSPGVSPSIMMSKGPVSARCPAIKAFMSRISSGII